MKILLTHRYFWPDTAPYALMLRAIGEGLCEDGHEVHVFASKPSYRGGVTAPAREDLGALKVRRSWVFQERRSNPALRALNVVLYCLALFWRVLMLRPDVVTASTFPPVLAAWWASLAARLVGAKFVYHMQDIHPEVSRYSGGRLGRGFVGKLLTWLDNQTLRRSAAILVLSPDMADTLATRGLGDLPIHVLNNFQLDDFDGGDPPPSDLARDPAKIRVIFAGNLGRFQNLPLLAEGVARCFTAHPELELFFLGDGAALPDLKARWGDHPQVRFGPFLPFAQARPLIEDAQVGLVSLTPDIYRVAYPSKLLTYAGLGVPVLALVEPESQLAQELVRAGIGRAAAAPTAEGIATALEALLSAAPSPDHVRHWYAQTADRAIVLERWRALVQGLHA